MINCIIMEMCFHSVLQPFDILNRNTSFLSKFGGCASSAVF